MGAVGPGDLVEAGQTVAAIEAMQTESALASPLEGRVERIAVAPVASVQAGDLVLVVRPAAGA